MLFIVLLFAFFFLIPQRNAYAASQPQKIFIPKIPILLPVETAKTVNREWQMTDERSVFFGDGSALPGEQGTTVLFAHAQKDLFGLLPILKKGNSLIVVTSEKTYMYEVNRRMRINETDTDFITADGPNSIALLTCSYSDPKKRLLIQGSLIHVFDTPKKESLLNI